MFEVSFSQTELYPQNRHRIYWDLKLFCDIVIKTFSFVHTCAQNLLAQWKPSRLALNE